jgi:hypothetical protein
MCDLLGSGRVLVSARHPGKTWQPQEKRANLSYDSAMHARLTTTTTTRSRARANVAGLRAAL